MFKSIIRFRRAVTITALVVCLSGLSSTPDMAGVGWYRGQPAQLDATSTEITSSLVTLIAMFNVVF